MKERKRKGDKTHTSVQKSCKIRSKNFPSASPFPPSPLKILPSIRSGFDQIPTSYEPLFGSTTTGFILLQVQQKIEEQTKA